MFIRRKPNRSGSISVQLIEKRQGRYIVVRTFGSSRDEATLKRLEDEAEFYKSTSNPQQSFNFGITSQLDKSIVEVLQTSSVRAVGPELVLGKIFDQIGFNKISEALFKDIVLARLVYPSSKLKTTEYLLQHQRKDVDVERIYRFLDRLKQTHHQQVEEIAFEYSRRTLGEISVVFYDMTTLHFEAEDEDDLRKIGFSKSGKFQHPQIMLGLLVGRDGYPISYDIFEGNTWEGKTLLPIIERAQSRFKLTQPIVIADSGLLSQENLRLLAERQYKYIIGARIKNEAQSVQKQILKSAASLRDKQTASIEKSDGTRLIIDYSQARAKKDASNREKGIKRLQKSIASGRLTKSSLNKKGYNKFLTMKGDVSVSLDEEKITEDTKWDGLKGYLTNATNSCEDVVSNYRQLWKIEKAFRISKTDLRIRPIFHRKRSRIEAHICIAFVAYTVFKELERLLLQNNIPLSAAKAIELTKTIFELTVYLKESARLHTTFIGVTPLQQRLLEM